MPKLMDIPYGQTFKLPDDPVDLLFTIYRKLACDEEFEDVVPVTREGGAILVFLSLDEEVIPVGKILGRDDEKKLLGLVERSGLPFDKEVTDVSFI